MTGNSTTENIDIQPELATVEDGPVVQSMARLKPVKYPLKLNDIAVIGRTQPWQRLFLLRPKFAGRYLFIMYPKNDISLDKALVQEVLFQSFNSRPELVKIEIPKALRDFYQWSWRLIKIQNLDSSDSDISGLDSFYLDEKSLIPPSMTTSIAENALKEDSISTLIFDLTPSSQGEITFSEEISGAVSKTVAWSCHQPFDSQNGKARIWKNSGQLLEWYRDVVQSLSPHRVWALGDTSYSDGTGSLDFVRQLDNKAGWHNQWDLRKDLLSLFRLNYRYHWSFDAMQETMCHFPHLAIWDDHEIRDGFGSDEKDFSEENKVLHDIARQAAEEYLFSWSPRLRSEAGRNKDIDSHQAYIDNPVAAFIFDGRNSRNYGENLPIPADVAYLISAIADFVIGQYLPTGIDLARSLTYSVKDLTLDLTQLYRLHNPGEVISQQQLKDFEHFCQHLKGQRNVKYVLLGNSVPFIYILDFIETLASEAVLTATHLGKNIRDDIRDSWHSPANRRQLRQLIDILRDLHHARPDIEFINISGDIHISNAFTFQPEGFEKPIYQITSSALTNRVSISETVSNLMSVDGPLSFSKKSEDFGKINRLWHEGTYQNFLSIDANEYRIQFKLHVFNKEGEESFGTRDRLLTISPTHGYELK